MALIRYTASADTTIVSAFEANMTTRGTGSNMGYADALEVFSIYGQDSGSNGQSQELSRALMKFPTTQMSADRTAGRLGASGSVSFFLKIYNAKTPFTLPQNFNLVVAPISKPWSEGSGLDMDNYQDIGSANWMKPNASSSWSRIGGDYHSVNNHNIYFPLGPENLEVDISNMVERWIAGSKTNNGLGIRLTGSQEAYFSSSAGGLGTGQSGSVLQNTQGAVKSYYTKRFFSRSTQFFFQRPVIEARWDDRVQDDRENFFYSSSLAPAADNLNRLYLYNYIRGRLVNIPKVGTGKMRVSFYSGSATAPTGAKLKLPNGGGVATDNDTNATASYVSRGLYYVDVALTAAATPLQKVYGVWHSGSIQYYTGSFYPEKMPTYDTAPTFNYINSCTNLKKVYSRRDKSRFRFFIRNKNWSPTVYTISTTNNPTLIVPSASFNIRRVTDNWNAIPYGTGSAKSTYLSYDKEGNYFDLDVSLLESGYMYEVNLSYYNDSIGDWQQQPQTFKFRVEE
jgi:hypothetical protein